MAADRFRESAVTIIAVICLLLLALPLLWGGVQLLGLGGSAFYLLSGVWLLVVAFGVLRRQRWSGWAYSAWLAVLLGWSLWEAGLHWWPLATRLGIPVLLGLLLYATLRATRNPHHIGPPARTTGWPVLAMSLLCAVVAFAGVGRPVGDKPGTLALEGSKGRVADPDGIPPDGEWPVYAGTGHGLRYSPLTDITADNVARLEPAWQYRTGDMRRPDDVTETTYQVTPLKIGNRLYLCTPHNIAIALDADTGKEVWRFDAQSGMESQRQHQTCRGLSWFDADATPATAATLLPAMPSPLDAAAPAGNPDMAVADPALAVAAATAAPDTTCRQRLFLPTADAKLYALDAQTGQPCSGFGQGGQVDLLHNMPFKQAGYYYATSPPVVGGGLVIVNGAVNDNYAVESPSGVIRAYDALTGQLRWNWDSGNASQTAPFNPDDPSQVYTASSPNSWSVGSIDEKLGLVYFPMGNQTPDQLTRYRNDDANRHATSVVALDLASGQLRWVQQFVHHDLWDMDTASQPVLVDLDMPNGRIPALVQPTKQGDIYVLDRRDGTPLMPIGERPAPQTNDIPGQTLSPTQPFSALSFEPPPLREADMWGASLVDQMMCRIAFRKLRYEGRYTPPSTEGTIVYPGNFGVFNWGSVAIDPVNQIMFGMPTYLAFTSKLVPKDKIVGATNSGEQGLNEIQGSDWGIAMMPFLSPIGVPCQQPPWGTVAAVDLRTGKTAWQHRNGTIADLAPLPLPWRMGVPGIGGPMITAGGVAFLGAAVDNYFRAYDLRDGTVLWESRLPAGGQATPMSYRNSAGEQIVVLVAGGHGSIGTTAGDYVMAWKLPAER